MFGFLKSKKKEQKPVFDLSKMCVHHFEYPLVGIHECSTERFSKVNGDTIAHGQMICKDDVKVGDIIIKRAPQNLSGVAFYQIQKVDGGRFLRSHESRFIPSISAGCPHCGHILIVPNQRRDLPMLCNHKNKGKYTMVGFPEAWAPQS